MSVTHPAGFVAAGAAIGLKASGGKDFALVVNQGPTFDSATVFTSNRCKANPVLWTRAGRQGRRRTRRHPQLRRRQLPTPAPRAS